MRAFFGSAIFGFGASAGRDAYRASKNNIPTVIVLLVLIGSFMLPFLGGRELTRRHERGFWGTLFKTFLGSAIMISVGFAMALIITTTVYNFSNETGKETELALLPSVVVAVVPLALGLLTGMVQRYQKPLHSSQYSVYR